MALSLRPLRPGDEEAAVRWAADPEFCRAADWAVGLAPSKVRSHWQRLIAGSGPDFLRLGVEQAGRFVGYVDLAGLTRRSGEFGIAIGERSRWGRGLGSAAGRLMLAHAYGTLELEIVTALVHTHNAPSHALMRRLGFREAGRGEPEVYQGQMAEVIRYELQASTWFNPSQPPPSVDT